MLGGDRTQKGAGEDVTARQGDWNVHCVCVCETGRMFGRDSVSVRKRGVFKQRGEGQQPDRMTFTEWWQWRRHEG